MDATTDTPAIAFAGVECVAAGTLEEVAVAVKTLVDSGESRTILVFDSATSEPLELDLRGSAEEVVARLPRPASDATEEAGDSAVPAVPRGPGRPRLGVVPREVTLLPRHWEWLSAQPGGASVTLRKLVEKARREGADEDRQRRARDAAYRFMLTLAGNETGFEEATRALYAGDEARFEALITSWPPDVREHARVLARTTFSAGRVS